MAIMCPSGASSGYLATRIGKLPRSTFTASVIWRNGDRYFILDIIEFLCNARHKFLLKGANYAKNPETYNK
jgi:hypothetical protein